jgi:hypothetical protein
VRLAVKSARAEEAAVRAEIRKRRPSGTALPGELGQ